MRQTITKLVDSSRFQLFIIGIIIINAFTLGLETDKNLSPQLMHYLHIADRTILAIFVIEIIMKFIAFSFRFFKDAWNVFDFIIVGIALVPAAGPFSVLRVLRILRVLRLVSMMPKLRLVVEALLRIIPAIASVASLLLIVFYVFGVIGTGLFGPHFPQWFGNLGRTLYSLFQIMTLESWSMGIARPVLAVFPYAWIYFVSFILITTFTVLNLVIAVIVNAMMELNQENQAETKSVEHEILQELQELKQALIKNDS